MHAPTSPHFQAVLRGSSAFLKCRSPQGTMWRDRQSQSEVEPISWTWTWFTHKIRTEAEGGPRGYEHQRYPHQCSWLKLHSWNPQEGDIMVIIIGQFRLRYKYTIGSDNYLVRVQLYLPFTKLEDDNRLSPARMLKSQSLLTIKFPLFSAHISLQRICWPFCDKCNSL